MSDAKAYTTEQESELPLMSHLIELRNRLLKAVVLVVLFFACMFPFSNDLYLYLSDPLRSLLPEGSTMIATQVASPFLAPFQTHYGARAIFRYAVYIASSVELYCPRTL